MKKGFSLLVAIFTILLLSLVAAYIFYTSATVNKVGTLQYQKEQAMLLARSYTEYAVLAIQGHDREATNNCVEEIKANIGDDPLNGLGYRVIVKINYIGNEKYVKNCSNTIVSLDNNSEDTFMAIIDVYVQYKNLLHPNKASALWITYHKRSLQKI
jgi:hypothetical protein